ncbi:unnamed protein product [Trichogramma brassicae]|uniref:Uncharacterized protein n=1 Tax=Trichogramma brassicae TaxID=86971 RepID=A0A6H5J247_9HYME|nr:unnamed protein product [Trichogramma brassicae]
MNLCSDYRCMHALSLRFGAFRQFFPVRFCALDTLPTSPKLHRYRGIAIDEIRIETAQIVDVINDLGAFADFSRPACLLASCKNRRRGSARELSKGADIGKRETRLFLCASIHIGLLERE